MSGPISTMIERAPPDWTVTIPAGVHEEAIVVSKPINLRAEKYEHTTIKAPPGAKALQVNAACVIDGIRFEGAEGMPLAVEIAAVTSMIRCDVHGASTGLGVLGKDVIAHIEFGFMTGSVRSLFVGPGAGCALQQVDLTPVGPHTVDVDNGILRAVDCHLLAPDAGGARVRNGSRADFHNCLIDAADAEGEPHGYVLEALLQVRNRSVLRLGGTTVHAGRKAGILFFEGSTGRLDQSLSMGNAEDGLLVMDGSQVAMSNGFLAENGHTGVLVARNSKAGLRNVRVKDNGCEGLSVQEGGLLRARDCREILGNKMGAFVGVASLRLRRCDLRGNALGPLRSIPGCDVQTFDTPMHGHKQVSTPLPA